MVVLVGKLENLYGKENSLNSPVCKQGAITLENCVKIRANRRVGVFAPNTCHVTGVFSW